MANKGYIDQLVDEKAFKQIDTLIKNVNVAKSEFLALIQEVIKLNTLVGGSKTFKDFQANVEKSAIAMERLKKAEIQTEMAAIRLAKAREQIAIKIEKQQKAQELQMAKLTFQTQEQERAFVKLAKSLTNAEKEALDLGATFGSNSKQFQDATLKVRELRAQVDKLEQPLGRFQRNVGNYEGGFRNLNNSINQFTRELPNAGISLQTFIMSLSNQYGQLYDSIRDINDQNKELIANGQKPVSVFKQIGLALFSLQTVIAIAITAFIAYREEIGNFFSSLGKGSAGIDAAKGRIEALNQAVGSTEFAGAVQNVIELRNNINLAKNGFIDKEKALKQYNETIGQTIGEANSLNQAEALLVSKGQAFIDMTLQKAIAQAAAGEAAKKAVQAAVELKRSDEESGSFIFSGLKGKKGYEDIYKREAKKNREAAANAYTKEQDVFTQIFTDAQKRAAEIARDNNFDFFGGQFEGGDKNDALKRILEAQAELIRIKAEGSKQIADDESVSYEERNRALSDFLQKSVDLENKLQEIKLLEENLSAKEIEAIKARTQSNITNIDIAGAQARDKINQDEIKRIQEGLDEQDKIRVAAAQKKLDIIETERDTALLALDDLFKNGNLSEEEYSKQRLRIQKEFTEAYINEEIKAVEALIAINKSRGIDTAEQEKQLAALKIKLSQQTTGKQISDLKTLAEAEEDLANLQKSLRNELAELAETLVFAQFERETQRNEKALEDIDKREEKEKRSLENQLLTKDEKEVKTAQIEARAQVAREGIEKRQRDIDVKRARFEKLSGVARAIAATASAEVQALTYLSNPFTAPLYPAIAATIAAVGAAQIATILATPIPKFEDGGVKKGDGLARYSEGGKQELMITPDGKYSLTPPKETVSYVKDGTRFVSNPDLKRLLAKPDPIQYVGGQAIDMKEVKELIAAQKDGTQQLKGAILSLKPGRSLGYNNSRSSGWSDYERRLRN